MEPEASLPPRYKYAMSHCHPILGKCFLTTLIIHRLQIPSDVLPPHFGYHVGAFPRRSL